MAKRLPRAKTQKSAPAEAGAEDLSILSPNMTLTIADRKITIREYEFFEGLDIAHKASAFIDAMAQMCNDGRLRYDRIRRLFGVHRDVVIPIAAQSADVEVEWVTGLKGQDAEVFVSSWFAVNSVFFLQELVVSLREQRQSMGLAGQISSSPSPPPASATSASSSTAPNDS